jgi:hypothetical protein
VAYRIQNTFSAHRVIFVSLFYLVFFFFYNVVGPAGKSAVCPLAKNIKTIFRLNVDARAKHSLTAFRSEINYGSRGLILYCKTLPVDAASARNYHVRERVAVKRARTVKRSPNDFPVRNLPGTVPVISYYNLLRDPKRHCGHPK